MSLCVNNYIIKFIFQHANLSPFGGIFKNVFSTTTEQKKRNEKEVVSYLCESIDKTYNQYARKCHFHFG